MDRHLFTNGYSGWAVVVYEVPFGDQVRSNKTGGIDYKYGSDGIALLDIVPILGTRKDEFLWLANPTDKNGMKVRGSVEFTGVKKSEVTGRKWNYLCSWVGTKPSVSHDTKVAVAIAKAESVRVP